MPKLLLREPKGRAQSPHLCPDSFSSHLHSPRQDWGGVGGSGGKAIPSTRVGGIAPATQVPQEAVPVPGGLGADAASLGCEPMAGAAAVIRSRLRGPR